MSGNVWSSSEVVADPVAEVVAVAMPNVRSNKRMAMVSSSRNTIPPRRSRSHTGGGTARLPRTARRPGQKTTKILGRAIDGATGKPVAEVDVQLSSSLDSAQATTRTDGHFKGYAKHP